MKDFIEELKYNQNINFEKNLENRIDIDYVIERLEDIQKEQNNNFQISKIYIALEENYHLLACEIGASEILGVYDTIDKALDKILKDIEISINEYNYVIDNECDLEEFKKDKAGCIRLFHKEQENWDYHCEYRIIESEINYEEKR